MGIGQKLKDTFSSGDHRDDHTKPDSFNSGSGRDYVPPTGTHVGQGSHGAGTGSNVPDRDVMDPADHKQGSNVMSSTGATGNPFTESTGLGGGSSEYSSRDQYGQGAGISSHDTAHRSRDTSTGRDHNQSSYDNRTIDHGVGLVPIGGGSGAAAVEAAHSHKQHHGHHVDEPVGTTHAHESAHSHGQHHAQHHGHDSSRHEAGTSHGYETHPRGADLLPMGGGTGAAAAEVAHPHKEHHGHDESTHHTGTSHSHDSSAATGIGGQRSYDIGNQNPTLGAGTGSTQQYSQYEQGLPSRTGHDYDSGRGVGDDSMRSQAQQRGMESGYTGQGATSMSGGLGSSSYGGSDDYGAGRSGATVFHKCEHCGRDNDISNYFKKDAAYRTG
ncbi:hypothetical protein LTS08_004665 [Lithohypha guttulata]|nr:hypothetical protein LTS08_004665 [Lithohypha guttulata]